MPATAQDITHYAGDSATIVIGPVVDEDGVLVDLAGALGARWWMGKTNTAVGSDVYVKKNSAQTQVNEAGGTDNQVDIVRVETDSWYIYVRLLPADTETTTTTSKPQPNPSYYHECEVVDADGKIATVSLGKFVLKPTVVRNA